MDRCTTYQSQMLEYLYDLLDDGAQQEVGVHLVHWPACQAALPVDAAVCVAADGVRSVRSSACSCRAAWCRPMLVRSTLSGIRSSESSCHEASPEARGVTVHLCFLSSRHRVDLRSVPFASDICPLRSRPPTARRS